MTVFVIGFVLGAVVGVTLGVILIGMFEFRPRHVPGEEFSHL